MPAAKKTVKTDPFAFFKLQDFDQFFDPKAFTKAQEKNVAALIEANRAALEGYQAVFARQTALFEEAVSKTKADLAAFKPEALTQEAATAKMAEMKEMAEKSFADMKEVVDMAQTAQRKAFEILQARAEEAMAEVKAEAEKLAA
ncbi:MAG: phasin family protein [Pseudomonadota bacterium]